MKALWTPEPSGQREWCQSAGYHRRLRLSKPKPNNRATEADEGSGIAVQVRDVPLMEKYPFADTSVLVVTWLKAPVGVVPKIPDKAHVLVAPMVFQNAFPGPCNSSRAAAPKFTRKVAPPAMVTPEEAVTVSNPVEVELWLMSQSNIDPEA